jgi:hypothetical protein
VAWCKIKHKDNFAFAFTIADDDNVKAMSYKYRGRNKNLKLYASPFLLIKSSVDVLREMAIYQSSRIIYIYIYVASYLATICQLSRLYTVDRVITKD